MHISKTIPISPGLLYDGSNLIDDGKPFPLTKSERTTLEMLLRYRGQTVKYNQIFEEVFSEDHEVDSIEKSVQDIMTKIRRHSKKLCIKNVTKMGYTIPMPEDLRVKPQFVRNSDDALGVFAPCNNHIPREEPLSYLQEYAFRDSHVFAISGPPGMGKTELAKAFVYRCCSRENVPDHLRYETVLSTTYHKNGLRATIENLPCEGTCSLASRYKKITDQLKEMKKPVLLVIDNADTVAQELESPSKEILDLLKCGCHLLFTSRQNLSNCPHVRCMELEEMETSQLETLFRNVAGPGWEEGTGGSLKQFIERHLKQNTYLVTLAAGLMKSMDLDKLIQAFEIPGEISEVDNVSAGEKDGKKQTADTLMGHFKRLYNLQDLPSHQKILLNLALLPHEGLNYNEFFTRAFRKEERMQGKKAFQFLKERHWVFLRNQMVSLHPMVRELVLAEAGINYNRDIQYYLQNTADKLNHCSYSDRLLPELKFGTAAMDAVDVRKIRTFAAAQLAAQIASAYDTLTDRISAYSYGIDAKARLDETNRKNSSYDDFYRMAQCYSVTGYAILHYEKGKYHAIAKQAEESAARLVESLLCQPRTPQEQEDCSVIRSKIFGNYAACLHAAGDFESSKDKHMQTLQERLAVNEASGGKYDALVASAYKNLATEYFYLSKQKNREENLNYSYENHKKAVGMYATLDYTWKLDWCIAANRMIGTGLLITETLSEEVHRNILTAPLDQVLPEYLDTISNMLAYLVTIAPIENELKDCIQNTTRILKLFSNEENLATARKILTMTDRLPETVLQNLHKPLQALREMV